ncbi:MAG: hypothetical protein KJP21_04300 [Bacteroidia bacterium]|nr:hypothetical protein [Bacteroidia bacterium]NNJ56202.1 hypothetical protein [Bacteroidia bacterium]
MVEIRSNTNTINKSSTEVFEFLSVPENYRILMPSKVRSFSSTEDTATLDIEGVGSVELAFTEKTIPSFIEMKPQNKVPFEFNIQWNIREISSDVTEVEAVINAKLNFMMKMMAEKMLGDFLNVQVHKLTEHLNA